MENSKNSNSYKTLSVVLIVLLVAILIGGFLYWRDLNNTQKEQQAQINELSQQATDTKNSISQQIEEATNKATETLSNKNAELQQKIDSMSSSDDSVDSQTNN